MTTRSENKIDRLLDLLLPTIEGDERSWKWTHKTRRWQEVGQIGGTLLFDEVEVEAVPIAIMIA